MKKIFTLILIAVAVTTFTDCGKKANELVLIPSATLTIDGATKSIVPGAGVLSFENQLGHQGRALTLSFIAGGNAFSVAVANWDFQAPPDKGIKVKSYSSVLGDAGAAECLALNDGVTKLCDSDVLTYIVASQYYSSVFYTGNHVGSTRITVCDPSKSVVSGDFDMTLADVAGDTVLMKGTFVNIKYIVNK